MPSSSGFQVNEILTAANTNTYLLRPYTNTIINAGMSISQRGTIATGIASGDNYGAADRWLLGLSGAGTWTMTTETLTSADAPMQDGVRNSFKVTCTTANASLSAGAYLIVAQKFEGNRVQQFAKGTTNARNFALSFWVRSNRTGTYNIELADLENNRSISAQYTVSSSGVWQKVRLIFPADITGTISNDNLNRLSLYMWIGAGSNFSSGSVQSVWGTSVNGNRAVGQVNVASATSNYFEVTAVQLEPNNVCTPFEVVPAGDDFIACRRYFQRHITPSMRGVCAAGFTRMALHYGTPMRTLPTLVGNGGTMGFWDGVTGVIGNVAIIGAYSFGSTTCEIDISSSGWTARAAAVFYQGSTFTFILDLNAEM